MDINAEAKRWSESNGDKTLEQAFVAGFTLLLVSCCYR